MKKIGGEKMSKNLIVLFIVVLLIVGGFSIYTYDQSNQAKKELEEKNLELESSNKLISELKENIKEKEKQIEELSANLTKEKKDLEQEYTDKLSILTEEKAKLEALLAEKEKIWLDKDKEKEQFIIKLEEEVKGYKENISKLDNEIVNLKEEEVVQLTKEKKDLEQEYTDKLSGLMEEKIKLGTLLAEKEEIIKTIESQKEEAEQAVFSKDRLISELKGDIEEKEAQINELKDKLTLQESEKEKDYTAELSILREEKSAFETQLKTSQALLSEREDTITVLKQQKEESEKNLADQDKTVIELSESIKGYENQVMEIKEQMAKEGKEKEAEYTNKLSTLSEEKSAFETQLKTSQALLSERENTITVLKQQKEESEKNLADQDKTVIELSESIKGYENQVMEIKEQMAKEGKEKEAECASRLSLLMEEKSIVEAKLAEAMQKGIPDYYEVKRGDSLWKIAERFYNQGEEWIKIFEANLDKIKNPNLIYPYQRLTIPKE